MAQTSVFSHPLFKISQFPPELRGLARHELLLTLRARPATFKVVVDGYPGHEKLMEWYQCSVGKEEAKAKDIKSKGEPHEPQPLREVVTPSGLESVVKD